MPITELKIGEEVKRNTTEGDYENECGVVIDIDLERGRARIQWEHNRTWYKISKLLYA